MKRKGIALLVSAMVLGCFTACSSTESSTSIYENIDGITYIDYKNMEIEDVELIEVTDEEIEESIESVLAQLATSEEVTDREVESGDIVNIDYVGTIDDEVYDDCSDTGADLTIGSETFIDGFEEGLIGFNIGDTVVLDLAFPDDYWSADFAGVEITFEVLINSISVETLPEFTDELVLGISDVSTTTDEYREEIRTYLEAEYLALQSESRIELIWMAMVEGTTVEEYPEEYIQSLIDYLDDLYTYQAESYYEITLEEFVELCGMTMDEYNAFTLESAQQGYKSDVATLYIAEEYDLDLTDEEYQAQIDEIVTAYGYTTEDEFYEAMVMTREELEVELLTEVVLLWLSENVTYVEAAE